MGDLKPAPEGQPTSSVMRFLEHSRNDLTEWEHEVAALRRKLRVAENRVACDKEYVKLYGHQVGLRLEQGRKD